MIVNMLFDPGAIILISFIIRPYIHKSYEYVGLISAYHVVEINKLSTIHQYFHRSKFVPFEKLIN